MPAEPRGLEAEIREVRDRQQITEGLYAYCRAVDRIDRELGYSIWNEGAQVDYGQDIFVGEARALIDHICASHEVGIAHSHQLANVIISLRGDRAVSEAYVNSAMQMPRGDGLVQINTRGRYLDRWSRHPGGWGIDRRIFVCDLNEVKPAVPGVITPRVRLDRQDLSFALFAGE